MAQEEKRPLFRRSKKKSSRQQKGRRGEPLFPSQKPHRNPRQQPFQEGGEKKKENPIAEPGQKKGLSLAIPLLLLGEKKREEKRSSIVPRGRHHTSLTGGKRKEREEGGGLFYLAYLREGEGGKHRFTLPILPQKKGEEGGWSYFSNIRSRGGEKKDDRSNQHLPFFPFPTGKKKGGGKEGKDRLPMSNVRVAAEKKGGSVNGGEVAYLIALAGKKEKKRLLVFRAPRA